MTPKKFEHLVLPRNAVIFFVGMIFHAAWWLIVVNLDAVFFDFVCSGIGCTILVVSDFPVSLLFIEENEATLSLYSFLVGSLWWGLLFILISPLFTTFFKRRSQ